MSAHAAGPDRPLKTELSHERACERIGKYSASANADSERQRGGLMSAQETTSPKRTVRPSASAAKPAASVIRSLLRRPRIVVPGLVLLLELVACFGAPVLAPDQPQ